VRSSRGVILVALGFVVVAAGLATYRFGHDGVIDRLIGVGRSLGAQQSGRLGAGDRNRGGGTARDITPAAGTAGARANVKSSGPVARTVSTTVERTRVEDVTESVSKAGHQRRQGVFVADWDCDGELDVLAFLGGVYLGDRIFSALTQDPSIHTHWLKIKLVATKANRLALGAKIRVDLKSPEGETRSIYRAIGNNGSFGGNSAVETIGLGPAAAVENLTVSWPITRKSEVFHQVAADQLIEITEGAGSYRAIHQKVLRVPVPAN
jgi:hypothetical protein